jgi:hypothetical protein
MGQRPGSHRVSTNAPANDVAAWPDGKESPRTFSSSGVGCGSTMNGLGLSTATLIPSEIRSAPQMVAAASAAAAGRRVSSAKATAIRIQIAPP